MKLYDRLEPDLLVATLKATFYFEDGDLLQSYYLEMHNGKVISDECLEIYRVDDYGNEFHLLRHRVCQRYDDWPGKTLTHPVLYSFSYNQDATFPARGQDFWYAGAKLQTAEYFNLASRKQISG